MNYDKLKEFATDRQWEYFQIKKLGMSNVKVAETLGIDRRAVDRGVQAVYDKATSGGVLLDTPGDLKILSIDIETAPMVGYLWSLWREARSMDFIERDWYITSYAYKWLGKEEVYGKTLFQCKRHGAYKAGSEDDRELIEDLWKLFSEADVVVAHNGDKFDIKKIKTRMLTHIMKPPAPFRTVDTLKVCKREFGFTSNRLDHIAKVLLGEGKLETGGVKLWIGCIKGDKDSWDRKLKYNMRDVDILERVYLRIRAWDRSHPNMAIMKSGAEPMCNVCTSTDLKPLDKKTPTNVSLFDSYECKGCGHKMRGRKNIRTKEQKANVLHNAR